MPRPRVFIHGLAAFASLAALLAGCAPTLRGPAARPTEGLPLSSYHNSNNVAVFEHPAVARLHADLPAHTLPETRRRDRGLGLFDRPIPVTADRPSLDRARRTTLPRTARELILF